jgi:hypothetical protein
MTDKPIPANPPLPRPGQQAAPPPIMQGEPAGQGLPSINEPPGSNTVPNEDGSHPGLPVSPPDSSDLPLELDSISPEMLPLQPSVIETVMITATGKGFTSKTVMLFDDEEVPTEVLSPTSLRGTVPTMDVAGVYDVELQREDDLSDVLEFEFVDAHASEGKATKKPTERKPAKAKDAPRKTKPKSKR